MCKARTWALPGAAIIELSGVVDGSAAEVLTAGYEDMLVTGGDFGTIVLDFAAVDYIDSVGIALIVSVLARARAERRKVAASGLSAHYREIFDITRLSDFIELFPDLDHAVGQVTGSASDDRESGSRGSKADEHTSDHDGRRAGRWPQEDRRANQAR